MIRTHFYLKFSRASNKYTDELNESSCSSLSVVLSLTLITTHAGFLSYLFEPDENGLYIVVIVAK